MNVKCRKIGPVGGFKEIRDKYLMKRIAYEVIQGFPLLRIAKRLKMKYADIFKYTKRDEFAVIMDELENDLYGAVDRQVRHLFIKAVKRLGDLLESNDSLTVQRAVDQIFQLNKRLNVTPIRPRDMNKYDDDEREASDIGSNLDERADKLGDDSVKEAMKFLQSTQNQPLS